MIKWKREVFERKSGAAGRARHNAGERAGKDASAPRRGAPRRDACGKGGIHETVVPILISWSV